MVQQAKKTVIKHEYMFDNYMFYGRKENWLHARALSSETFHTCISINMATLWCLTQMSIYVKKPKHKMSVKH